MKMHKGRKGKELFSESAAVLDPAIRCGGSRVWGHFRDGAGRTLAVAPSSRSGSRGGSSGQ